MLPPISLDGVLTSRLWSILLRLVRLGALGSSFRVVVFVRFWRSVLAETFFFESSGEGSLTGDGGILHFLAWRSGRSSVIGLFVSPIEGPIAFGTDLDLGFGIGLMSAQIRFCKAVEAVGRGSSCLRSVT
jgi:hypothetical protein